MYGMIIPAIDELFETAVDAWNENVVQGPQVVFIEVRK